MSDIANIHHETDRFLFLVGKAITEWALIEEELFQIVLFVLNCSRRHSAIIYYRTPTLDGRISLTDELIETLFPEPKSGEHAPDVSKRWEKIVKDLREELKVRNQLAHCPAAPVLNTVASKMVGVQFDIDISYASYTSRMEKLRPRKNKSIRVLMAGDIDIHLKAISSIINRLRNFQIADLPNLVVHYRQEDSGMLQLASSHADQASP